MSTGNTQSATMPLEREDPDLVDAARRGDASAFGELIKRYDRKLLRIAGRITNNREDAEDVVQEAFLKAFQNVSGFRGDSRFSTWLFRITVNQALMKVRKRGATKQVSLGEDIQTEGDAVPREVADWAPNPEELYRTSELREILSKVMGALRPTLRTVFVLRDIEGLSIEETAEVMNLTHAAVKARLGRARLQLRERLSEYFAKRVELDRLRFRSQSLALTWAALI